MSVAATWLPYTKHGRLTHRTDLPDSVFAFPYQRKEPLTDASHVRDALARFDQVEGVTAATAYFRIELHEASWRELGKRR